MADKIQLEITLENGQFKVAAQQAQQSIAGIQGQAAKTDGMSKMSSAIGGAMNLLKGFIALKAVGFLVDLGKSAIKAAGQFEQTAVSFEVMIGDAQKAQKLMTDIKNFAASTPFTMKGLAENAKLMMSFGIESEQVMENLKMLGDVSGGNQERMNQLSLAFSQCASTGRLMGQDLLQMINGGFNPLKIMSEQTGVSMGELKKKMEAGQITFENVRTAFQVATEAGGQFYGMMDKQSQTIEGKLSTLEDTANMLGVAFGSKAAPGLYKFIDALTDAGKEGGWLSGIVSVLGTILSDMLNITAKAVNGISSVIKKIQKELGLGEKEYYAGTDFASGANDALDAQKKIKEKKRSFDFKKTDVPGGLSAISQIASYLSSGDSFDDKMAREQDAFDKASSAQAAQYDQNLITYESYMSQEEKIFQKHNENVEKLQAEKNEKIKKTILDTLNFTLDATKQALELQDKWEQTQYENRIQRAEALGEYLKAYNDKQYQDELQRQGLADLTKSQEYAQQLTSLESQLAATTDAKERARLQDQINETRREQEKENLRVEYEQRQKNLDTALELYKKMQARKEFERAKAFQIAMVWINAAAGIAAAWGSAFQMQSSGGVWYLGLALGIASTALLAAMAAAQTAIISNTHAPMFEQGVFDVPKTTPAILHGGESVITKPITESIKRGDISLSGPGGGGSSRVIQLLLDGKVVTEVVDGERNKRSASMGAGNYSYGSVY